jgi:hypothetical protein
LQYQQAKNIHCCSSQHYLFSSRRRVGAAVCRLAAGRMHNQEKFNHGSDQLYFAVKKHIFCASETDPLGAPRDTIQGRFFS